MVFHKIEKVSPLPKNYLEVVFLDGTAKRYDTKPLKERYPVFSKLDDSRFFQEVKVDTGGYGIIWDDDVDLSCNELWNNGLTIDPYECSCGKTK